MGIHPKRSICPHALIETRALQGWDAIRDTDHGTHAGRYLGRYADFGKNFSIWDPIVSPTSISDILLFTAREDSMDRIWALQLCGPRTSETSNTNNGLPLRTYTNSR